MRTGKKAAPARAPRTRAAARPTLGLLLDQLASGYARLLFAGIQDWCVAHDADLIVFTGRTVGSPLGYEYQSNVIYEYIRKGTVDALVMASGTQYSHLSPEEFRAYIGRFGGIPRVSVGMHVEGVPSILVDNHSGILQAMEHLAGVHRIRRVAFMEGPSGHEESAARSDAYAEAVLKLGLDNDPMLRIGGDFTRATAREAMEARLQRTGGVDFQALVAANDEMAIAACQVLAEHGYAVPRDVAVVGFDDIMNARFALPSLTTVDQSLHSQGWTAAELAAKLARGESVPPETVLSTRLVPRTSCGCMPAVVIELSDLSVADGATGGDRDAAAIAARCLQRPSVARSAGADAALSRSLEALAAQTEPEGFLTTLHEILVSEGATGRDVARWHPLLAALEAELTAATDSEQEMVTILSAFQRARALLADVQQTQQARGLMDLRRHLHALSAVMEGLISVASINELMDDLAPQLSRIDLSTCIIVTYGSDIVHRHDDEWRIPTRADVMLAVVDGTRVGAPEDGEFSPAVTLVPPGLLGRGTRHTLVATSMHFREEQIGYLLFEPGRQDVTIYETFAVLLANVLKGSRLLAARQRAEDRLRQALVELEEYNQKLSGLSQTDDLTGLYNRRAFVALGTQNLSLARRMGRSGTVFFLDMDDLKKINDSFGHQEGDAAIRRIAKILSETFRHIDVVARLGGDEFAVLAVDTATDFSAMFRGRLEAALASYNAHARRPYALSVSIGSISFGPESTMGLEQLLRRADQILYKEKKSKKARA